MNNQHKAAATTTPNEGDISMLAHQSHEDNAVREVVTKFLSRLYADAPATEYFVVSSMKAPFSKKRRMMQEAFLVRDIDKAVEYIVKRKTFDVWTTPTTFGEPTRALEDTVINTRRWIYADHDVYHYRGDRTDEGRLDALKVSPTMKVETSPGSFQLYWDLGAHHTDIDVIDESNRAMVESHVEDELLDNSVKEHNRILRVPGTVNLKPHHEGWVVRFDSDNGNVVDYKVFGQHYDLAKAKGTAKKTKSKAAPNKDNPLDKLTQGDMHPLVRRSSENHIRKMSEAGSRHIGTYDTLYNLACYGDEGLSGVDVAVEIVRQQFEEAKPEAVDNEFDDMKNDALRKASAGNDIPEGTRRVSSPDNPAHVAEDIKHLFFDGPNKTTIYAQGVWFKYTDNHWSEVTKEEVLDDLNEILKDAVFHTEDADGNTVTKLWKPNITRVENVLAHLRRYLKAAAIRVDDVLVMDTWIGSGAGDHVDRLVPLKNGLLDPLTRKLYPFSPGYFNTSVIDTVYDPSAKAAPNYEKLIRSQWPVETHQDQVDTLEEFMGYYFVGGHEAEQNLIIVGPPGSGKGTLQVLLESMMGTSSVGSFSLQSMGNQFALKNFVGKKLMIAPDSTGARITDTLAVERILSIPVGDTIEVDRKNRDSLNVRLGNMLIMGNTVPAFKDASGAVEKRFVILEMTHGFRNTDQMDYHLKRDIVNESSAVLNRILDAYDRLRERGLQFKQPESARDIVDIQREGASVLRNFLEDHCVIEADSWVAREEFFKAYEAYCDARGYSAGSRDALARQLKAAVAGAGGYAQTSRNSTKTIGGTKKRIYKGFALHLVEKTTNKFGAIDAPIEEVISNRVNHTWNHVPEAATPEVVKAPEKPVEPTIHETRSLVTEDGNHVVVDDLRGGWDPIRGQFRVTVYDKDRNLLGQENGSGQFLKDNRSIDVAVFTE